MKEGTEELVVRSRRSAGTAEAEAQAGGELYAETGGRKNDADRLMFGLHV